MEKMVISPTRALFELRISKAILGLIYLVFFLNYSSYPQEGTFTNPIRDGADPWVFQKGSDYYYCASEGGGISVSKSDQLTDHGTMIKVWNAPGQGWNAANIWAPELHYIDGNWYIYYAAGEKQGGPFIHQQSGVLKSEGEDPFGPYLDMGMLYTGDDLRDPKSVRWAIDLTPMEYRGQWYAIWSGWEENSNTDRTPQHLYIAEMSDPMTISSNRIKLSSPEESWETGGELDLNEGPQVLQNEKKTFIIYSTRESWLKDYRLGQLELVGQIP
jgi:GH43 family beta-xylosidase